MTALCTHSHPWRIAFTVVAAVCVILAGTAWSAPGAGDVQAGNLLYKKGKFQDAVAQYEKAGLKNPKESAIDYDLGTAYYKSGDYDKAVSAFQKGLLTDDEKLRPKVYYNLGNAWYKSGISREDKDIQQGIKQLEESLSNYEKTMAADVKNEDAKANRDFVMKELARLKEKQQQQQQQQDQNKDQNKEQKKDQPKDEENKQPEDQQKDQPKDQQKEQQENQQEYQGGAADQKKDDAVSPRNDVPQPKEDEKGPPESKDKPDQGQDQSKDQQDQTKEQSQEKQDKGQPAPGQDKKDQAQKPPTSGQPQQGQVLSQDEARAILDDFDQNDQPKGLLNFIQDKHEARPVEKDW